MELKGGAIKNVGKGFFFIKGDDGVEYFAHKTSLGGGLRFDELRDQQRVSFVPGIGPKGPRTEDVRPTA